MSSPSSETETHEVALSREEQWTVHHVLATRIDDAIDANDAPPEWALEALEALESGDESGTFTGRQATELAAALSDYLDDDATEQDAASGADALDRFESALESRA